MSQAFVKKTASLDMNYVESTQLNKDIAKQYKLSPDSLMQLVVQVSSTINLSLADITSNKSVAATCLEWFSH